MKDETNRKMNKEINMTREEIIDGKIRDRLREIQDKGNLGLLSKKLCGSKCTKTLEGIMNSTGSLNITDRGILGIHFRLLSIS